MWARWEHDPGTQQVGDAGTRDQSTSMLGPENVAAPLSIREITSLADLQHHVHGCQTIAVVKFYQQNCRLCRALKPKFEHWAQEWAGQAEFFSVDLAHGKEIFAHEKVGTAPTIHVYTSSLGKVLTSSCSAKSGGTQRVRQEIAALLEPARLATLTGLTRSACEPARRYLDLVGVLRAIGQAVRLIEEAGQQSDGCGVSAAVDTAMAALGPAELSEIASLFEWVDRDGDGWLTTADASFWSSALAGNDFRPKAAGDGSSEEALVPMGLGAMYRLCRTRLDLENGLRAAMATEDASAVDMADASQPGLHLSSFTRLMALHAANERAVTKARPSQQTADLRCAYLALQMATGSTEGPPPILNSARVLMRTVSGTAMGSEERAGRAGELEAALWAFDLEGRDELSLATLKNMATVK